ncbi:MAG: hypothetical protein ACE5GD_01410 [Candidatus Geothermarchaeales archaeon]
MSRWVIERYVVPLLLRSRYLIDEELLRYLEEELGKIYAPAGGIGCRDLEEAIKRQLRIYPEGFEEIIRQLLERYERMGKRGVLGVA